jgi:hypothetical protein
MLRTFALLSIVAPCATFGSFKRGVPDRFSGECSDEPPRAIAETTATMGKAYAKYTSCDAIAAAGGCAHPDAKVACCATCGGPQRTPYFVGYIICEACASCCDNRPKNAQVAPRPRLLPPPPPSFPPGFVPNYVLIASNKECRSSDTLLGTVGVNLTHCAALCRDHAQCRYFAYGKTGSSAAGHCYYERTTDACQTEGYHYTYKYDFYDTLYIYTSIGNGVCRNGANNRYPPWGWVVGSFTTVRAACNADQYCLGYWCARPHPATPPPAIDGKSPRVDLAGCIRRTRQGAGTRSSARSRPRYAPRPA